MADITVEEIADAMFDLVKEATGMRKLKPIDLTKTIVEAFADRGADKKMCKTAIRQLIESERCVYTYFGGSYIELPHREGAAND
ncbi:hypothetical protein CEE37_07495 [candidate division LCP-89 bacterium B3_LCP]|uniref:DsrD n=1 Tax=candidate division LCP-89 bacterium B3_LCP TaxID=2012998 RepID=A0A532V0X8_UNCL8|nr:MAG: hypothetical protein CEE37_07495 [candidate division LCP-89 bacterium B3_LCP]